MEIDHSVADAVRNARFDDKWELLKPEMEAIYLPTSLKDLQEAMRARYGFSAK